MNQRIQPVLQLSKATWNPPLQEPLKIHVVIGPCIEEQGIEILQFECIIVHPSLSMNITALYWYEKQLGVESITHVEFESREDCTQRCNAS
jgi:hypothetical protein